MTVDAKQARAFVEKVDLSGTPRNIRSMSAATEASAVYDQAKDQAQIVGSGIFAFAQGVDAAVREAIADSALLAQLVANKRAPAETDPVAWFSEYSKVLQNVGWTVQESGWSDYTTKGTAAEVHEKIVDVLTAIMAPAPAALAIVKSTMDALKAMKSDSPWITLFEKESQKAKIARFQIGFVEKGGADSEVFVSLVACLIEAKNTITQVLLFKFRDAEARFKANSAKVSINRNAATEIGPAVRTKIKAYQADYLSSLKDI